MPTGAANANHTVPPRENFDEKYAIVAERNIFLRDRVRRPPPGMNDGPHNEPPTAPPASLESQLVLRGIAIEDGSVRAYFENTQTLSMVQAKIGDAIAHGHLTDISVDSVAYESPQGQLVVYVGSNLEGRSLAPATQPSTTMRSGGAPSGPASAIEERMRQQRLQRTGGR